MRGRKPSTKDNAGLKIKPVTHDWFIASYRDVCFRFSVDFSGDKPLFALADLIAAIYQEPSNMAATEVKQLPMDDKEHYAFKDLYDKYLKKRALFGDDAIGSKQIREASGVCRWYVNGYLARLVCLLIERMGETNEVRYKAKGLRKALESDGLEASIKAQFQVILESKLMLLKAYGLI